MDLCGKLGDEPSYVSNVKVNTIGKVQNSINITCLPPQHSRHILLVAKILFGCNK